jgi:hypothetical protein
LSYSERCTEGVAYQLVSSDWDKNKGEFRIHLSHSSEINIDESIELKNELLVEFSEQTDAKIEITSSKFLENEKLLILKTKTDGVLEEQDITLKRSSPDVPGSPLIEAQSSWPIPLDDYPIPIKQVSFYSNEGLQVAEIGGVVLRATVTVATAATVPLYTRMGIFLIKLVQVFDYINIINTPYPRNLSEFLRYISQGALEVIPNFFALDSVDDTGFDQEGVNKRKVLGKARKTVDDRRNRILMDLYKDPASFPKLNETWKDRQCNTIPIM